MKNIFTLLFLVTGLSACTSFDFTDRSELIATQGFDDDLNLNEIKYGRYGEVRNVKTLGVLTIADFNKAPEDRDEKNFVIKREKKRIFAETKMFESDNKDKSFFDESYFNFGVDRKTKGMSVELTLKF